MAKYFTPEEFTCKHCGQSHMNPEFVRKLDVLRERCGFPLVISSGYRCPEYNSTVSKTGDSGPHTTGRAVDILVHGSQAFDVISLAKGAGMTGIGIQQRTYPHNGRFIHLDDLEQAEGRPRPWVWSY